MNTNLFLEKWMSITPISHPAELFFYFELDKQNKPIPNFQSLNDESNIISKDDKDMFLSIFGNKKIIHTKLNDYLQNPKDYFHNYYMNVMNKWGSDTEYREIVDNIKTLFNYRFSNENFNLIWITLLLKDIINFNNCIGDYNVQSTYDTLIKELKSRNIKLSHLRTKKKYQLFDFLTKNNFKINNADDLTSILYRITITNLMNENMIVLKYPNNDEFRTVLAMTAFASAAMR